LVYKHQYEFYYYRGLAKYQTKDYQGAIADQSKVIWYKTNFAPAYLERGMCFIVEGEDDKAIYDFSKTLSLKPDQAKAYHYRGVAKKYKNNTTGACEDFTKARDLGFPKSSEELQKMNCGQ